MGQGRRKTIDDLKSWLSINLPLISLEGGQTYKNNKSKLDFICSAHGRFSTTWNQITRGSHCPNCGKNRLVNEIKSRRTSIEEVIQRIRNVHENHIKILNSKDYQHQHSRLNFRCSKGHEWDVKVYTVIQGNGCPKCAGKNITTAEFCETLKEVHEGRLTLVEGQQYLSRKDKLTFKCLNPSHNPFKAAPSNVIFRKSGCPECKKERLREVFKHTEETVYQIIASKDYPFSPLPNQLYTNQDSIWKFKCNNPTHPAWEAPLGAYLQGTIKYGCSFCAGARPIGSIDEIHSLCIDLFGDNIVLLDSSIPTRIIKRTTRLNFLCRKHLVEFRTTLSLLSDSKGCEKCSLESYSAKRKTSLEDLINQVKLIHRDFITLEDASMYVNTESKILFRCNKKPKHGVFEATAHGILGGYGCPICKMSKGERKIWFWLKDNEIDFKSQKRVKKHVGNGVFIFDFYLPSKKVIIEYDGRQHSIPVERWGGKKALKKTLINDSLKDEYTRLIGFEMMRIPYTDFESIDDLLNSKFGL
jgi:very-short-patch-repair endonuclease